MDFPNEKIIEANADVRVCSPGVSTSSLSAEGQRMETLGEIILGKFGKVESWPEMSGATFKVVHNSTITLYPPDPAGRGAFKGRSYNLFEVGTARGGSLDGEGDSVVEGKYQLLSDGKVIPLVVTNSGEYAVLGKVGKELYQSVGKWQASLAWRPDLDPPTLGGSANFKGTFRGLHYPERGKSFVHKAEE